MRELTQTGFTLTEMLVVVAVLAALTAVALPNLAAPDSERVELAAAELVQALRFARSEAERTRIPHGLRIDAATETVRLFRVDRGASPPTRDFSVRHPVHKGLFVLDYRSEPRMPGVGIDSAALSFASPCSNPIDLAFDEHGIPYCVDAAGAALTEAVVELGNGRTVRQVVVAGITGRVTLR
ncbi:hypothetical protein BH24PSE2_BH24PSE2_14530 [soil metagenome]